MFQIFFNLGFFIVFYIAFFKLVQKKCIGIQGVKSIFGIPFVLFVVSMYDGF